MQVTKKLGEDRSITGLVPALITLVSIAIVWLLLGEDAAFIWTFLAFCIFAGLGLTAILAMSQYWMIRDRSRDGCFRAFRQNNWVGGVAFAGMLIDYSMLAMP